MNPYSSLSREGYSDPQVMQELQRSGGYRPPPEVGGLPMGTAAGFGPPGSQSFMPGSGMGPPGMMNSAFPPGYTEDYSRMPPPMSRMQPAVYDPFPGIAGEVVVDQRWDEPQTVGCRPIGKEYVQSVKPYITMERMVEVPQTIIKESQRHVPKPEIVERIIEVPKMAYKERTIKAPPNSRLQTIENIHEVEHGVITETHQTHIPKTEIQERLIEIPKIEYREKIEYEDRIEYREVPVEKIVEVPQIEYVTRQVERYIPQTYVQEYYVPKYTEVAVQQLQEVERTEVVPVVQPVPRYRTQQVPVNVPVHTPTMRLDPQMQPGAMAPMPMPTVPGMGTMGPGSFAGPPPMGSVANAYANYDPMMSGGMRSPPGTMPPGMMPPGMMGMTPPGTMGMMPSGMMPPGTMPPGMMPGSMRMDPFGSRGPVPAY